MHPFVLTNSTICIYKLDKCGVLEINLKSAFTELNHSAKLERFSWVQVKFKKIGIMSFRVTNLEN